MIGSTAIPPVSAEFYEGSLIGKEVVPNMVDYAKDFLQPEFAAAGFHVDSVFEVTNDIMTECIRHLHIKDEAGNSVTTQAFRFNVLEL